MPHGGRGQVSARSVRRARRERKETYRAAPTTRRKINSQRRRTPSDGVSSVSSRRLALRPLLGVRRERCSSALQRHRLLPFRRVPRALRRRERAPALEAFHLSLFRARGFVLPVRPRVRLDERGFLPRALPPVHPPARLVGEVVLRARAFVVVLDGGVSIDVGRREARGCAGVRGSPRGRGSPPRRRARRSLGLTRAETAGRGFSRSHAGIGPAAEAFSGRACRRGLRTHAWGHARDGPRDAPHRRAERGHVHRSVRVDARDEVNGRDTTSEPHADLACGDYVNRCSRSDFADVSFHSSG